MIVRQAIAIGDYIWQVLSSHGGMTGCVRSVHPRVANMMLTSDEIMTIQAPEVVRTPLSLTVPWPTGSEPVWLPGAEARVDPRTSCFFCGEWEISLSGATVFDTRIRVQKEKETRQALQILNRHFACWGKRGSVHDFIQPETERVLDGSGFFRQYGEILRRKTETLKNAIRCGNAVDIAEAASGLIGLGPGLTPAGDDFLQGFLLFIRASAGHDTWVDECCRLLQAKEPLDTSEVSRAFWRCFFAGHAAEPMKKMAEAFNSGDWEAFAWQAELISRLGHSSGEDWLTGAWWALKVADAGKSDEL